MAVPFFLLFRKSRPLWLMTMLFLAGSMPLRATVFDWDAAYGTWVSGSPAPGVTASQSYDIEAEHPGNDVTISIANSAGNPGTFAWVGGSPVVSNATTGGLVPAQNSLSLDVNKGNSAGITVTIKFNYDPTVGVTGVSFNLFDADKSSGQFIDQISSITGLTTSGATIGAVSVTGSTANQVTGSGTNILVTGTAPNANTNAGGNVAISFGTNNVTQVQFTWKNADAGLGAQTIALHDITYTPVPEVGSSLAALGLCGSVAGVRLWRKRRNRQP